MAEFGRTPRLKSAYPSTPAPQPPGHRSFIPGRTKLAAQPPPSSLASATLSKDSDTPLVPLALLDAPTQRLYFAALYVAFLAWKSWDFWHLVQQDAESVWYFMKWTFIDGLFLYSIPTLKVPWIAWSTPSVTVVFILHALLNGILMFRLGLPFESLLVGLVRLVYDRELAISEHRVKPSSLLNPRALILGKQIVNILPEGTAILNPNGTSFCVDGSKPVEIPLLINQTSPIRYEIYRWDLETGTNETIVISGKDAKKMSRPTTRTIVADDLDGAQLLQYRVNKAGLYKLAKVLDESNLEVQRKISEALVVQCPRVNIPTMAQRRCHGDLSDFYVHVAAVSPVQVKYSRTVNKGTQSDMVITMHADASETSTDLAEENALVISQFGDLGKSRLRDFKIPINETLGTNGEWRYRIDEIQDGLGNAVIFGKTGMAQDSKSPMRVEQSLRVYPRPVVNFRGCNLQNPLKVARGKSAPMSLDFKSRASQSEQNVHTVRFSFQSSDNSSEVSSSDAQTLVLPNADTKAPQISQPGIYTIESVSTEFCTGEVLEPSACLLINPDEPDLDFTYEVIPHQCAGNAIGLRFNLELTGTPPFEVGYMIDRDNDVQDFFRAQQVIESTRFQWEFKPQKAGHYTYEFFSISDAVYTRAINLGPRNRLIEQDIRPTAMARVLSRSSSREKVCLGESASVTIELTGEAPFVLEYDLFLGSKRQRFTKSDLTDSQLTLRTPPLDTGGIYSLALVSITDKSGCKIYLEQDVKLEVRHQKPLASFGYIDGTRDIKMIRGRKISLPIRFSGEGPFTLRWTHTIGTTRTSYSKQFDIANSILEVSDEGSYELEEFKDKACQGVIDERARTFSINWLPRPQAKLDRELTTQLKDGRYVRNPVCEGDLDAFELGLSGRAPYNLKYDIRHKSLKGSASTMSKRDTVASNSFLIRTDTSSPGLFEYHISELGDQLYEHDRATFEPLRIQQTVYPKPNAAFADSSRFYSFCKEPQSGAENIPIILTGTPPFSLEMSIKHHTTGKLEIIPLSNIQTRTYDFRVPHNALSLDRHTVSIRKISDSNGCQTQLEAPYPHVQVNVVNVPTISSNEPQLDFCVGDRLSFSLSGTPPFNVFYTFEGRERKATVSSTTFRRLAEKPGNFTIFSISDRASPDQCRASESISKIIHELPSVKISKGLTLEVDIHEGGETELVFDFKGVPPFEFTYTRSTNPHKNKKAVILETKHDISYEFSKTIRASQEGTYEVVSIKDRYCGFTVQSETVDSFRGQKLLDTH